MGTRHSEGWELGMVRDGTRHGEGWVLGMVRDGY